MSRTGDAENLTHEQMVQVIEHFMYRLNPDGRHKLMAHLPQAYNAYYGREIVKVTHFADGRIFK